MTLRSIRTITYICSFLLRNIPTRKRLQKMYEHNPAEASRISHQYVKKATNRIFEITGSTITVNGIENIPEGACLFAGNHSSYFDIVVMENVLPEGTGFVAKDSLGKIPELSGWMSLIHCLFLDRKDMKEGLKTIFKGAEYLSEGYPMCIFPEGTRCKEGELGEFKPASLKMAQKAKVPVVPVAITGTSKIFETNSFLSVKPSHVTVTFAPPVLIHELPRPEQKNVVEMVRQTIKESIESTLSC